MDHSTLSANWKKLQSTLPPKKSVTPTTKNHGVKRKAAGELVEGVVKKGRRPAGSAKMAQPLTNAINQGLSADVNLGKYIAVDCEMVGVGPNGRESSLARVSIVNYDGDQIYDSYVKQKEEVTDWRTHVSGISPKHMYVAREFETVQNDVCSILQDRILIGHSVRKDLEALLLSHPWHNIRDTAKHPPYRQLVGGGTPKLQLLASELLGIEIQTGEHSSIEDARATMLLFRRDKDAFERAHAQKEPSQILPGKSVRGGGQQHAHIKNHKRRYR